MDFELSERSEQWRGKLQAFFDREVLPRRRHWLEHVALRREAPPFMDELQAKARARGLWNIGLPELAADEPGTRLSNLDYAPLAEIMGRLFWAPEADLQDGDDAIVDNREFALSRRASIMINDGHMVRDARRCRAPHHEGPRPHPEEHRETMRLEG